MDSEEMGELLIRIDERQEKMQKDFEKVANGVGFPRCAERGAKIGNLAEGQKSLWKSVSNIRNTGIGAAITLVVGIVIKLVFL